MPEKCPSGKRWDPKTKTCVKIKAKPLESEYHTSGMPENLYTAEGDPLSTMNIDEGQFGPIKDSTVTATGSGPGYTKGQVFHLRGTRTKK